ncbi:ATP-binding protein [Undibacterium sp.]|jgi:signal transduction histidine kinase/AmiR/NasT family two-component response regulator|uniref:ATP-binding protein n=1 Tax=Undibacterium sp. TaxID=1914977 RepID=UPI002B830321|nr:ATP-binding protein [Undibacterium sp.]HTD02641.1 ATP-binding protein [Undibacterium sp.]
MSFAATRTVRQKLLGVVLVTTLVTLLFALAAIILYNLRVYHTNLFSDMSTQAELLGHMTAPALNFDDKQLASQNLNLLKIRHQVRAAAIYNAKGELFSSYLSAGEHPDFPVSPEADGIRIDGSKLRLFKRISSDGEVLGTVYMRADYELVGRILDYLGIAAIVIAGAMVLAYLMSVKLQKLITAPILSITDIAREVVERRDYSRRAEKISDDEIGVLVEAFNNMLAEIARSTAELQGSNQEIVREVGERRRAQQEIMRLNAELEQRVLERTAQLKSINKELILAKATADQANQAKSAFLSSMSHELRTPLNAILGFAQLLATDMVPATSKQKHEFAEYILKAGRHLLVLINEVLDLAKVESGNLLLSLEPVALSEVMHECKTMIEPLANKRGVQVVFPPDQDLHVVADRTRLKQVLLNLLSNAIKYNRENGSVIVSHNMIRPECIQVTVQDTGAGLAAEQLQQLFQPFNRLGQETGGEDGTGIGLVVTKRLVELMGGQIGVSSTVGIGSVFWLELKSTAATSYALKDDSGKPGLRIEAAGAPHALHTLLYVEDNPANLKLIQELIAFRRDIYLLTAVDGRLGLELAREHQPEVILMDINLPDLSGNEVLLMLLNDPRTSHIPVIALSANAMHKDIEKSMSLGFFRYLTKPIDIDEFLGVLDQALDFADSRSTANKEIKS